MYKKMDTVQFDLSWGIFTSPYERQQQQRGQKLSTLVSSVGGWFPPSYIQTLPRTYSWDVDETKFRRRLRKDGLIIRPYWPNHQRCSCVKTLKPLGCLEISRRKLFRIKAAGGVYMVQEEERHALETQFLFRHFCILSSWALSTCGGFSWVPNPSCFLIIWPGFLSHIFTFCWSVTAIACWAVFSPRSISHCLIWPWKCQANQNTFHVWFRLSYF